MVFFEARSVEGRGPVRGRGVADGQGSSEAAGQVQLGTELHKRLVRSGPAPRHSLLKLCDPARPAARRLQARRPPRERALSPRGRPPQPPPPPGPRLRRRSPPLPRRLRPKRASPEARAARSATVVPGVRKLRGMRSRGAVQCTRLIHPS